MIRKPTQAANYSLTKVFLLIVCYKDTLHCVSSRANYEMGRNVACGRMSEETRPVQIVSSCPSNVIPLAIGVVEFEPVEH
ncbi:hypothetical protein MUK42_18197 [Musa troglodytarum]|uniref:Uncharacterized protein n=1 Tax=Musa troglodytarum TaxID=320322 RepID=A0A9E7GX02_9LILI|nr:hypothetical protein MUK42_18197 [Musa troglodytarum]